MGAIQIPLHQLFLHWMISYLVRSIWW